MKQIVAALCVLLFISCSKDGGDTQKPVLVLNTPTANQQFPAGSIVNITGTVTDNDEIHEVHVYVINKNTDSEVLHFHEHADSKSYNISQTFTAQAGTSYRIKIEADDHVGNTAEMEIEVRGN